jgi:hypothetical protein
MNLLSVGLLTTILLGLPACEKQPAHPASPSPTPKGVDNKATSAPAPSPSRSPVEPPARAEVSMSPPLQKTPGNGTAAPTLSTSAGTRPAPTESATPSDATLPAGGRPVFKNQAANDYLESYDAYITDFKEAYRQMRQGEMAKYEAVIARVAEIQSKGEQIRGELSLEEQEEFTEYLARRAQELAQSDRNR